MRLTKIEFNGYKRLADTSCNVDGRLIAFLGPNEAGKSSVLEALAWLSDEDAGELPRHLQSRALPALTARACVVATQFALDDDDKAALAHLDTDVVPNYYRFLRAVDGSYRSATVPPVTRRTAAMQEAVLGLLPVQGDGFSNDSSGNGAGDWFQKVSLALEDADRTVDPDTETAFVALVEWLRHPDEVPSAEDDAETVLHLDPARERAAELLEAALARLKEPNVDAQARQILEERRPEFLLFGERDRVLDSTYNLADPALHADVPPALDNLLKLAGTTVAEIRAVQTTGDISRTQTLLRRANTFLRKRIKPTWRQSEVAVELDVSADLLHVLVAELDDDGATTAFAERSDGLRTFIALICFLAEKEQAGDVPPVLMLDEAETHLHYDAQADLLDVLQHHVRTSKVIYTTHSPGCLPPDLGTGIRLVSPDPGHRAASVLKADFWRAKQPGFSPLLFAMGASAAAFSVCRSAVLAEGASDMILLPTLLRAATGLSELGYQVAPGLATRTSDLSDADVAARVVYLADGDKAGAAYQKELLGEGVDPGRIHLLPIGKAVEDLLEPSSYLAAVHQLMADAGYLGKSPSAQDLTGSGPIAGRLKRWCQRTGNQPPSKTAVASYLVQDPDRVALAPGAADVLQNLHDSFVRELGLPMA